jgi:hypothetical protein
MAAAAASAAPPAAWHIDSTEAVGGASVPTGSAPALSVVDRLASPSGFVPQMLLFENGLDVGWLRGGLSRVVELMPTLGCRAAVTEVKGMLKT